MITLSNLKQHLRIEDDDVTEDTYLAALIIGAGDYVKSITGIANDADAPARYDVAMLLLIGHWHGNRFAVSDTAKHETPLAFRMIIATLRTGIGISITGGEE